MMHPPQPTEPHPSLRPNRRSATRLWIVLGAAFLLAVTASAVGGLVPAGIGSGS